MIKRNGSSRQSLRLVGAGTQLAVSVLAGVGIGVFLDRRWGIAPWLTLTGFALGLAVGLYHFLRESLRGPDDKDSTGV